MDMIDIKIPAPPEGYEAFFNDSGDQVSCTHALRCGAWMATSISANSILARKKRTLADWANEQELFKALAKMRSGYVNTEAHLCDSTNGQKIWQVRIGMTTLEQFALPLPPDGCPGHSLVLRRGKWELA